MAIAVVKHAGARFVVASDPKLRAARPADGRDDRRRFDPEHLGEVWRELGMVEGFDVALEMSGGTPRRSIGHRRDRPRRGGGDPRHPDGRDPLDVTEIVFKMLTLRGIYGREMYETWYKIDGDTPFRPRYPAGDHPPVRLPRLRGRVRGGPLRRVGQGHHGLAVGDLATTPTRSPSSPRSSTTSGRASCTARSGSSTPHRCRSCRSTSDG